MIKVILSGCNGKMGHVISASIKNTEDMMITAGIDISTDPVFGYHVFSSAVQCKADADVIIDFSHPSCLSGVLKLAKDTQTPVIVATTGLNEKQTAEIKEAAKHVAVFYSSNMSLGVNLIAELAKTAANFLGNDFDIEIIEKHHNQKIDAPSGTALMLADEINGALNGEMHKVYDRHSMRKKRSKNEIGIHAVRGGTINGEHEIIFAGRDEVISIKHMAYSKEVFASGAVSAARFIKGKPAGLYNIKDML